MLASITLVPALFTLFGRKAFWPKVPKYGDVKEIKHGIWGPIAKFVVNKPGFSGGIVAIILVITALNVFNIEYEFDTVKKFPKDLPSRVGYEIVEARYDKGELAPSTLLIIGEEALTPDDSKAIIEKLQTENEIAAVRMMGQTEDAKALKLSVSLSLNPYSKEALNYMDDLREKTPDILEGSIHCWRSSL